MNGVEIRRPFENDTAEIVIYRTEMLQPEAELAVKLIERWGVVAAEVDGEDSAGRSRLRRMSPGELVTCACDTAADAMKEFRSRGWTLQVPSPAEAKETLASREKEKQARKPEK